jgi:hypothetical protein
LNIAVVRGFDPLLHDWPVLILLGRYPPLAPSKGIGVDGLPGLQIGRFILVQLGRNNCIRDACAAVSEPFRLTRQGGEHG